MTSKTSKAAGLALSVLLSALLPLQSQTPGSTFTEGDSRAAITTHDQGGLRSYELTSNAELRDNKPADHRATFSESPDHARIRTGNPMFDGLYAMAVSEALQNSVSEIKDNAYGHGDPVALKAFQTGEFWTYVWTRDLSYSVLLALAQFDPERAVSSLLFKTSTVKPSVNGGFANQIVQDTGSGGSYPVSSDRVVWALGADAALKFLPDAKQQEFLAKIYPILRDTIEQDRVLVFDPRDGLYRGEQSFLDWREQTYPDWTKDNVIAIAMSKALSVNAADHFLLRTASEYAGRLGLAGDQKKYADWAAKLKDAINREFYDKSAGLYATYLLADSPFAVRAHRYDLLGESLAVLSGVADEDMARSVISHYPTGPSGPSVVWPQERLVPIYHNQAIWPFVTAFWTEAARKAGNVAAVDEGIHSLFRGAAFNLSNMENFDFVTGKAQVKEGEPRGPVINSRRQLWSVAAYLAMVQDVVFGLEASYEGLRFRPFISARFRSEVLGTNDVLELRNFSYRGKMIRLRVHLLPVDGKKLGVCKVSKVELNDKIIDEEFVKAGTLQAQNQWDVYMENAMLHPDQESLNRMADLSGGRIFGPAQPEWDGKVMFSEEESPKFRFHSVGASNVVFNIYRDGQLCAKEIPGTNWTDTHYNGEVVHYYVVEAVDPKTGAASHLSRSTEVVGTGDVKPIRAKDMENRGGRLADGGYFMDWGKPGDELRVKEFVADKTGTYAVSAKFSNGAGPVNTGITCAIKKLEIRKAGSDDLVAGGYLVMPQSGDWQRFDLSSIVRADLKAGQKYSLRIFEDEYSRNMSYLAANARYTSNPGGGEGVYNFVNIAALHFQRVAE